jgi:uncharacterized protein YfcZ (UPF0381/DUF406 family)
VSTDQQRIIALEQNQKKILAKLKEVIAANNSTVAKVKSNTKRIDDGEKLDAKQQAFLDGMKGTVKSVEDTEKVIEKTAEVTA